MKMKKYFVSYNYGGGFGRMSMDSDPLTPNNIEEWLKETEKGITENLDEKGLAHGRVIILNIQEIK
ncbi:hypothetical protein LCGC14_2965360 [marine sediment metagenome]|uniref:Uncharacterized protein n=1 Tax=marine sediment metagenome TaxID=412755 RepID=A0A0F8ZIR1_9ZZZZ